MKIPPIKSTIKIDADVERVWRTLFNPKGWDPWFTEGMRMEMKEGGKIFFRWMVEDEEVIDHGIIRRVEPLKTLEFEWNEFDDGYKSYTKLEVFEAQSGGVWVEVVDRYLILNEKDLDDAFKCAAGWGEFLCRLKLWIERGLKF